MIPDLSGWTRAAVGDADVLVPREGSSYGFIRYVERVQPVRAVGDLVREELDREVDFVLEEVGDAEALVTAEGEYGVVMKLGGRQGGRRIQRDLGYVLGDEHAAQVSAVALRADQYARFTAAVRHLVYHDAQLLGVRRRRFAYAPPDGWRSQTRGFAQSWLCPAFPEDPASITVWPAHPIPIGDFAFSERLVVSQLGSDTHGSWPEQTTSGLTGRSYAVAGCFDDGSPLRRELTCLSDGRYQYLLRLDCTPAEEARHRLVFADLLSSVQPLPRPAREAEKVIAANLLSHWASG